MSRPYLIAGLIGIALYAGFSLFGTEFESTRLTKESPTQKRARQARSGGGGGGFFGGGFGGGK